MLRKNRRETDNHLHFPTILWKYGFNDKVELRVITNVSKTITNSDYELQIPVSLGFKTSFN